MKTRMQTDTWIRFTVLVLGFILLVSMAGIAISIFIKQSIPGILIALGFVAGAGLGKLWISPLK